MFPKDIKDALDKAGVVYGVGPDGDVADIKSGKSGNKLVLGENFGIDLDTEEIAPKIHGKYQSKRGIYDFMCAFGSINFLSKTAIIDGKFFDTLNLDGVKFQMTLKDDNTFDFEEIVAEGEIAKTTETDHQRFVEMFEESVISGFREKSVYSDFIFYIEYPITDENRKKLERNFGELEEGKDKMLFEAYLIVEPKKPYNNLLNFFDEDEDNENPTNMNIEQIHESETLNPALRKEIPQDADLSFLEDDDEEVEIKEPPIPLPIQPKEELTGTRAQIAEEFLEAKKQKLAKLLETLDNYRNELKIAKNQQNLAFTKIRECNEEIKTLSSRIDSLGIQEPLNGYFIYVPMVLSEKTYLEESVRKTIQDKLIAMNYPNTDYFMHLFDNAIYQIHIGCNTEEGLVELEDYKNVIKYFKDFDLVSQQTKFFVEDKKLFYEGQMDHADIINKLIKLGFSENPNFNEMCEAQHKQPEHEKHSHNMNELVGEQKEDYDGTCIELQTVDEPTTLVILGDEYDNRNDFSLTDDFSSYEILIGNKVVDESFDNNGFVTILTIEEFENYCLCRKKEDPDFDFIYAIDVVLLPNFVGTIGLTAKVDGEFTNDFNTGDYIHHQYDFSKDVNVYITLPENTAAIKLEKKDLMHLFGDNQLNEAYNQEQDDYEDDEYDQEELGDDFIFSILYETDDDAVCVGINPLSYWQTDRCQYDQEIRHILFKKFPILAQTKNLEEETEGVFSLVKDDGTYMNLQEAIKYLATSGLKYSKSFQDFMSAKDSVLINYLVSTINPDIIIK